MRDDDDARAAAQSVPAAQQTGASARSESIVSVVVCTLDRAESLAKTLESLARQDVERDEYEIVVVDNGSTDATGEVVEAARRAKRARVRYVAEPQRGLSFARNRGVNAARGDIVAFIDDDAVAAPGWIGAVRAGFAADPDMDALGGPVRPDDDFTPPPWFPPRLTRHLSLLDRGPNRHKLSYPHLVFGTNFAMRKSALERVGLFDPHLGRRGAGSLRTGEETELLRRVQHSGGAVGWEPAAIVQHRVDRARLSPAWLYAQTRWIGYSTAVTDRNTHLQLRLLIHTAVAPLLCALGFIATAAAAVAGVQRLRVLAGCVARNRYGYLEGAFGRAAPASHLEAGSP